MPIQRRNIYYIKRKNVEPNSNGTEEASRPVLIFKVYKDNVIFIPITKMFTDKSHIEINPISRNVKKTYVKISVVQTLSISKFKRLSRNSRNTAITMDDYLKVEKELINFFKI